MDFSRLRFWQWMIIGLLAGGAVGFAWSNLPNDLPRTGDRRQFVAYVEYAARSEGSNQPAYLRNIVIHEPETDPSNVLVYPVSFDILQRQPARDRLREAPARAKGTPGQPAEEPKYTSSGIYASTPFEGNDSIAAFLTKNKVPFADRSGSGRYVPMYYGAAAGFVAIGLLWPGAIELMYAAGLAKRPPPREKKVKVEHRTGEDVDEMIVKPTAKPVDAGALGKLNDAMEANLGATLTSGGPRASTPDVAEPISTLMSGARSASDPTDAPAPMTPEEKKDFSAGQYYPVARVTKKDDDKPAHP